jgi:hypothetical protein
MIVMETYAHGVFKTSLRLAVVFSLVTLFLPSSVEVAHATTSNWVEHTGSGTRSWQQVATSTDGVHLAAVEVGTSVGSIWTSNDSGVTWLEKTGAPRRAWATISSSLDGSFLIAAVRGGDIYTSANYGETWRDQTSAGSRDWESVHCDQNGANLDAAVYGGDIYTSSDYGETWVDRVAAGNRYWSSISASVQGQYIAATVITEDASARPEVGGDIYISLDYGVTWKDETAAGKRFWSTISVNTNGFIIAADIPAEGISSGYIWTSDTQGETWTKQVGAGSRTWLSVAISSDGRIWAGATKFGAIYISTDQGVTWTEEADCGLRAWGSIAFTSDGTKLIAAPFGDNIWEWFSPVPGPPAISPIGFSDIFEVVKIGFTPPYSGASAITRYEYSVDFGFLGEPYSWHPVEHYQLLTNGVGKQLILMYLPTHSPEDPTRSMSVLFTVRAINDSGNGYPSGNYLFNTLPAMPKPQYSIPIPHAHGFSSQITNFNPYATYSIMHSEVIGSTTEPSASINSDGLLTVSDLDPGAVDTVTVQASYRSESLNRTLVETSTVQGSTDASKIPIPDPYLFVSRITRDLVNVGAQNPHVGFDFQNIVGASYSCSASIGSCDLTSGPWVQIRDLPPGQVVDITLELSSPGYQSTNYSISAKTLLPGLTPTIGSVSSTQDGCAFQVTNYDSNNYYYVQEDVSHFHISPSGMASITGLLPNETHEEYVSTSREGYEFVKAIDTTFFRCTALPAPVAVWHRAPDVPPAPAPTPPVAPVEVSPPSSTANTAQQQANQSAQKALGSLLKSNAPTLKLVSKLQSTNPAIAKLLKSDMQIAAKFAALASPTPSQVAALKIFLARFQSHLRMAASKAKTAK